MAVAVGAVTSGAGSGTAARTMTYPAVGATDVVVAIIEWATTTTTLTPPTGFTAIPNLPAAGVSNIWIGARIGPGGGTSYTPSATTRDTWTILTATGADQTTPVNASASVASAAIAAAGTMAAPSVTTTAAGCLIISTAGCIVTATGTATTWTDPASTTRQAAPVTSAAVSTSRWEASDTVTDTTNQVSAGATTARTFTTSAAGDVATATIAIAPAASSTPLQAPALIRPNADVALGGWSPFGASTLWATLNEVAADTTTYVYVNPQVAAGAISAECEVALQSVTDPLRSDAHTISVRCTTSGASVTRVRLYQGATLVASFATPSLGGTWTTVTYTLTAAQADAITDYTNLRLRFAVDNTAGGAPSSGGAITQAYLDVPAPASTSTPFRRAGKWTY